MNDDVQLYVLSALRSRELIDRYRGSLKPEHFNEYCGIVYEYLIKYFDKYDVNFVSKRKLRLTVEETGEEGKVIRETVKALPTVDATSDLVHDKISELAREGIIKNTIHSTFSALEGKEKFDLDGIILSLQSAQDLEIISKQVYDYTEEAMNLHRSYGLGGEPIPTLIERLDETLTVPPTTGEEWIILGPPGRGKTQFLLNMIYSAAYQGYCCLYITAGDQGGEVIQSRLDSMISGIRYRDLKDPDSRVMGLLKKRIIKNVVSKGGKIFIQDWADTSCTPAQVESLVSSIPDLDLLAVDYPDIMRSDERYTDRRHEIASIFGTLRRIGRKRDLLVWSGSQTNRSALDKRKFGMAEVAEDIQKCWVADGIIAYLQTEEEKEEGMGRIYIPKARRPRLKEYEIPIEIDEDTGRIE